MTSKKKWIAEATKNKGALHRALGVPEDEKIPQSKLNKAAKAGGKLGKQANLAKTLAKFEDGGTIKKTARDLIREGMSE